MSAVGHAVAADVVIQCSQLRGVACPYDMSSIVIQGPVQSGLLLSRVCNQDQDQSQFYLLYIRLQQNRVGLVLLGSVAPERPVASVAAATASTVLVIKYIYILNNIICLINYIDPSAHVSSNGGGG